MYKYISIFALLWMTIVCSSCNQRKERDVPEIPIVILYENDAHCAVEGYARLAAIKGEVQTQTPYVATVSCGDFVQGGLIGAVSHGKYIVDIMNRVGYDAVALGNHEFDFGIPQMRKLTGQLDAPVVCANFRDLRTGEPILAPYHIVKYGNVDVAFIGVTTSETMTSTSPLFYRDETGNLTHDFMKEELCNHAQRQIDAARADGADYVVALSHLGDLPNGDHCTSPDLIAQTTGLDVVLDGHSHSIIADTTFYNREGKPVLLSSTGTKFQHIGLLTIHTDGSLSTRLTDKDSVDNNVEAFVDSIQTLVENVGNRVICHNRVSLNLYDKEGNNIARLMECPLGNLCADAFRHQLNADVALINGGGIREAMPNGEVTYNHLRAIFPFSNTACTATLTGQQLADALEFSVSKLPQEDGTFMQVSGLRFEVNSTIPSPVVLDNEGLFSHVADAPRRVSHIYIKDWESSQYLPLVPEQTYTLAGFDYHIKKLGSAGIFRYATLKDHNLGLDVDILSAYITEVLGGTIHKPYHTTEKRIRIID